MCSQAVCTEPRFFFVFLAVPVTTAPLDSLCWKMIGLHLLDPLIEVEEGTMRGKMIELMVRDEAERNNTVVREDCVMACQVTRRTCLWFDPA